MTRGMPAIWSAIVSAPFLSVGIGVKIGYLDTPIPSRYGDVSLVIAFILVSIGCYIHLMSASPFEPGNSEDVLSTDTPSNPYAQMKAVLGLLVLGLAGYWLFLTEVPYVYPTASLVVGSYLFATGIWTYWVNTLTTYYLTEDRLITENRLFGSKRNSDILAQVKTVNHQQPLYLRIFGLGNIHIDTGARRLSEVRHVRKSETFVKKIREAAKKSKAHR